jgi:hypothetical protein
MQKEPEQLRARALAEGAWGNVVRVSLPAEVAFDVDRFQEIQKSILGKLGCMACCSGWDIRYDIERRFIVDEKLNVRSVGPGV